MPARLGAIIRGLSALGVDVDPPSKGAHYKVRVPGGRPYILPAHNAEKTEISDEYIKALCKALNINYKTFKESL